MTLTRIDHPLSTQGMVTLSELREQLLAIFGARPHYYTLRRLIREGMPCILHPWISGRFLFDVEACVAWLMQRGAKVVQVDFAAQPHSPRATPTSGRGRGRPRKIHPQNA